ncbi:hypothetical protein [Fontibacter flavus]|uniref:O-antigen ligase n=1 Tax=Fontibacter flavus TaxID=654838 RepID=A0ABV6FP07_9BACT
MISESTEKKIKSIVQIVFLVLVVAISLKFFDAKFLDPKPVKYMAFLCTWTMIGLSLVQIVKQKGEFTFPVRLIFFSIAFSIFMAYYSWDQSLFEGLLETTDFMLWPLFFFLLYLKIPIKTLEKIIVAFGLLYAILYFYQYANSGTVIFGKPLWGDEFLEQRGAVRIIFPGAGIFLLTIFISITKITTTKEYKWFWIGVAVLGLIIPVMQVTRQFIAGVYLLYLIHFSKGSSFFKKMMVVLFFIGGFILLLQSDLPMIQGLLEVGQRDAELGSNYIRVLAGEYFIKDFSPNNWSYIFGNGAPNWGVSSYGQFIESLALEKEFFMSDVGIIAVYAMFGVFAILGFLLIWYKSFTIKVPAKYAYVKYYLWYILFTSVTWYSVYHYHYLVATIFAIYIYQTALDVQKREMLAKKLLLKIQKLNSSKTFSERLEEVK